MNAKPVRGGDQVRWNEIDESRDNQLMDAVDNMALGNGLGKYDYKWLSRYEAAICAYEKGKDKKLIDLEKDLGIAWTGAGYKELEPQLPPISQERINALIDEVCKDIERQKRSGSWLNRIFKIR